MKIERLGKVENLANMYMDKVEINDFKNLAKINKSKDGKVGVKTLHIY
jgi:hypothetical protein